MNLSDDKQSPLGRTAGAVPVWGPACAAPAHPLAVGAVGFGPAWQDDDGWVELTEKGRQTVADNMAASIVRLEQELEEANARVAVLEEEQKILAKGCKSCGVPWAEHLGIAGTCEALRQALEERDEARAEAARLRSMSHVEMMSENLNVYDHTVEWENRCLKAERERDEARAQYETIHLLAEALAKTQVELKAERDEARLQYGSTLALAEALAKTQVELKAERDEARALLERKWHGESPAFVDSAMLEADKLRPRQGASIYEIAESVREKYDPEYEGEGIEND